MKTLLALCAAASLGGCAVYPGPAYDRPGHAGPGPYIIEQPAYIYGGTRLYRPDSYWRVYPDGYRSGDPGGDHRRAPPPVIVVPQPRAQVPHSQPRPGRGQADRDRDGIPDRLERDRNNDGIPDRTGRHRHRHSDRDGDGIPNRQDLLPNPPNPRQ